MRTHKKYRPFANWFDRSRLDAVAHLRNLIAARVEPVVRGLRGGAVLDLVFGTGDDVAVVPFIEIAPEMLQQREASPFIWPHDAAACLGDSRIDDFERVLLPWIEALTLARQLSAETTRVFGDNDARKLFEAAREARFPGATPYTDVLEDAAPYVYALRFVKDGRAVVRDSNGAFGSVLLGRHARDVRADTGAHRNDLARRWFGKAIFGSIESQEAPDVAICSRADDIGAVVRIVLDGSEDDGAVVRVATAIPTDVMIALNANPLPVCRTFAVSLAKQAPRRPSFVHAAPQSGGGSAGRILMLMRDDYDRVPDADTDEASALASLLRAEGFTVDMKGAGSAQPAHYDLVHAFTIARVNEFAGPLAEASAANVPVVMTPFFQDVSAQAAWGTAIVRALLRAASDETELEDNLALVGQRRLEAPGLSAKRQEPYAGYDQAVRTALGMTDAVIVSGPEEERQIRAFGFTGPVTTAGPCVLGAQETDTTPLRNGDFVLAHAPLEARSNLLLLVRAAVSAGVPLVIAGPALEPEYVLALREQADEQVVIIDEPAPEAVESLYRSARLYADVSWIPFGTHRAVRAAACGAALVLAKDSHAAALLGPQGVWAADPASESSIALALGDAWKLARERSEAVAQAARRAADLGDGGASLRACAGAYAAAQQARSLA